MLHMFLNEIWQEDSVTMKAMSIPDSIFQGGAIYLELYVAAGLFMVVVFAQGIKRRWWKFKSENKSGTKVKEGLSKGFMVVLGTFNSLDSKEKGIHVFTDITSSLSSHSVDECFPLLGSKQLMKFLAWNCQGMGSPLTKFNLKDLYVHNHVSLLCLFETKSVAIPYAKFHRAGFVNWEVVNPCGRAGGMLLCWKDDISIDIIATHKNFIHCLCLIPGEIDKPAFYITFVYGCPIEAEREALWDFITDNIRPQSNDSWCLIGDFNEIELACEKTGIRQKSPRAMQRFNDFLNCNALLDIESKGSYFTWSNKRKGIYNVKQKLDRAVCNVEWLSRFPNTWVTALPAIGSDHSPIILDTEIPYKGRKRFRFEAFWLDNPDCTNVVHEAWSQFFRGSPSDILNRKINICTRSLSKWSKKVFTNSASEIAHLKILIHDLQTKPPSDDNQQKLSDLNKKLETLWDREEKYWALRSRIQWLKWGDKNSAFFHTTANVRRARNRILRLKDKDDRWTESPNEIRNIIQLHFKDIFTSRGTRNLHEVLNCINPVVTEDINSHLIEVPDIDEIKRAVWDLGATKAPGPDGLSGLFYRQFWDIVQNDIFNTVRDFFLHGHLHPDLNRTNIALIPKTQQPCYVTQFRPISCINFSYKIIAKIMANRLRPFMNELISPSQSAFIKGRVIQDNIIIAQEVGHALTNRNRVGSFAAVKLDMNKAYDQVEWTFLQAILLKLGFSDKWVDRVMTCVKTVSFSILVNGQSLPSFTPTRGIRQGDPLSPFLFTLVTEGLSSLIQHHLENNLLRGVKLAPSCPPLTHLLFADDSIFFIHATYQEAMGLKNCLKRYCDASGQSINFNKSSIVFSKDTTLDNQNTVLDVLNIAPSGAIGKYLGLPAEWGKSKIQASQWLIDRIQSKVKGWKNSLLSHAGKEVLIKSVIQAIPNYVMSVLVLPKTVYKKIDSLISKFWWGSEKSKGIYWVRWNTLTKPKRMGGVGFKDMEAKNLSLIASQVWRLHNNPESLAARTIRSLYHPKSPLLSASSTRHGSWCWRSLSKGVAFLKSQTRILIGDGKNTNIWKHQWIPNCPPLIKPTNCQINKVHELLNQDNSWNTNIISNIFPHNIVSKILALPRTPDQDRYIWPSLSNGRYSVKSGYILAVTQKHQVRDNQETIPASFWKLFWSIKIQPKILSFIWKAIYNGIAVFQNLFKRGCSHSPFCDLCSNKEETIEHMFFQCDYARSIWFCSTFGFRLDNQNPLSFVAWLKDLFGMPFPNKSTRAKMIARVFSICWGIWLARNNRIFRKKASQPSIVIQMAETITQEYWNANNISFDKPSSTGERTEVRWDPPPQGLIKINCDASFCASSGISKIAAVARNEKGDFLAAMTSSLFAEKPLQSEGQACALACFLAKEMGIKNSIMETDCKSFVDQLKGDKEWDWTCLNLFHYCRKTTEEGYISSCCFCPRNCNRVAHYLANSIHDNQICTRLMYSLNPKILKWVNMDKCNLAAHE